MGIKDPDNPLHGKEYRGGGTRKLHHYTTEDIAKVSGRAVGTIRNDVCNGKMDIDDLGSVVRYIIGRGKKLA